MLYPQGHLTKMISTDKELKQGCISAQLLFNIYINDMAQFLYNSDFHPPWLADRHISLLLYADDAVLLSRTPDGLKRTLGALSQYCAQNILEINYSKTKTNGIC